MLTASKSATCATPMILIGASEEKLFNVIGKVEEISNKVGLQMTKKNTKIIIINLQNNNKPEVKGTNNIETVDSFFLVPQSRAREDAEWRWSERKQDPSMEKLLHQSDIGQKLGFFGLPIL